LDGSEGWLVVVEVRGGVLALVDGHSAAGGRHMIVNTLGLKFLLLVGPVGPSTLPLLFDPSSLACSPLFFLSSIVTIKPTNTKTKQQVAAQRDTERQVTIALAAAAAEQARDQEILGNQFKSEAQIRAERDLAIKVELFSYPLTNPVFSLCKILSFLSYSLF
jgi:hypothetical protein